MGMFLSKYSMLHAIGYGGNRDVKAETIKILDKYKLFGIIIHDPNYHKDFDLYLESQFERLDYITGRDFLFFGLTNPSHKWIDTDAYENTKSSFNFLIDHDILKNLLFLKHQMKQ